MVARPLRSIGRMTAADALRNFITPLLPGWRVQFGQWMDGNTADRYFVIHHAGGLPARLVRQPQFTLEFIGAAGDAGQIPYDAANAVIEAMRVSSGEAVYFEAGEAVAMADKSGGRKVFEIAVSAITN